MNNEDKILSMLEVLLQGQAALAVKVDNLEQGVNNTNQRLDGLETKVDGIKHTVDMTFDQVITLTENDTVINKKLDLIEKEVSKHEEVILRKVK